jgi:hypothetical protein
MNNVKNVSRFEVAKVVADSGRKQTQGDAFGKFAAGRFRLARLQMGVRRRNRHHSRMGDHGTTLPLLRYLAARHKYWNDDYHVSDGLHYPEHAES